MNKKHLVFRIPIIGPLILIIFRIKVALSYYSKPMKNLFIWIFKSKEIRNFTYDLKEENKFYLASLISDVTRRSFDEIYNYFMEIENDEELKCHLKSIPQKSYLAGYADKEMFLGRRIGWYAFVRALKPKVVIETGIDKGLGACVLTAALLKNKEEGFDGYYYGTDIDPEAGYLLSGKYKAVGAILFGDSIDTLKKFEKTIDIFINDSDHSGEYEMREYQTIEDKLNEHAVILGDNSHSTDKLFLFSRENNRHFTFFQEKPKNHWYPGGGIGVSFKRVRPI